MKQFKSERWPDLEALEAFVAVADAGSFTAAAQRLGVSKVALSRRVTDLERTLGEKLLTRTTRSVRVTEAGATVRDRSAPLFDRARELVDAVIASGAEPRGRLRVVANQLIYELLLDRVVLPFARRHVHIQLSLDVMPNPLQALRSGYDIALVVGPAPDSSMGSLLLGRARLGCYASAAYIDRAGAPTTPSDLVTHAIAASGSGGPVTWPFFKGSRKESVTLTPRLSCASHDLMLRAAAAGIAIARLPHFYVKRSAKRAEVQPILAEWSCPPVAAYAIFPNRDRPSPEVRAFLEQLREPLKRT